MSDNTQIEWADATWNPVVGCDKVSPGCDHCYAIRTATRMSANPNPKIAAAYAGTAASGEWTGRVNLLPGRFDQPLRWRKPRRIFVNAQSDLFHKDVPDEFIARVWAVMAAAPQHTFQVLTKRPGRMRSLLNSGKFSEAFSEALYTIEDPTGYEVAERNAWPLPNVHLGVSVEDQKRADQRVHVLLDTPAAVRFLSCEPLLGPVDLIDAASGEWALVRKGDLKYRPVPAEDSGIGWVIVGGESGPNARPMHPDWARSLRDQCVAAGVPFHFKQWGEWRWVREAEDVDYEREHGDLFPERWECIDRDGSLIDCNVPVPGGAVVQKVGKKRAGRLLDGRTWDEHPEVAIVDA